MVFERAVQSYLWALPVLNMYGMKEGSEKVFGKGYNILPIFKDRLNAKTLITTPNSDVIYALGYLDLADDGPMVIEVPPGLQGILDDFFQRPICSEGKIGGREWCGDVGLPGPDKGKGGKYLLLPPDYKGPTPTGYLTLRSRTYGVFVFWRGDSSRTRAARRPGQRDRAELISPWFYDWSFTASIHRRTWAETRAATRRSVPRSPSTGPAPFRFGRRPRALGPRYHFPPTRLALCTGTPSVRGVDSVWSRSLLGHGGGCESSLPRHRRTGGALPRFSPFDHHGHAHSPIRPRSVRRRSRHSVRLTRCPRSERSTNPPVRWPAPPALPPKSRTLSAGLSLLDQADTLVSIAATAPSGAATYRLARQSALAAQAASGCPRSRSREYFLNGNYAKGDSAAKVAIGMAELANQALIRPSPVLVVEPNPSPGVLITATGNHVPNSYAGLTPQPFGAYAAGPYPSYMPDSLPFGVAPVGKKPALIAP